MTEMHDENTQKATESLKSVNDAEKQSRKSFSTVKVFFILLALGEASYSVYKTHLLSLATQQQMQAVSAKIEVIKSQQQKITEQFRSDLTGLDASQEKIALLEKHIQTALQQQSYQGNDWALLKARYYLELAQINAYWSDDPETTSAMLIQADALLLNTHDQRVFDVRRAISEENAQLQLIKKIDETGIITQLESAQASAEQLIVNAVRVPKAENAALTEDNTPESKIPEAWRQRLKNSLNLLKTLVVIRHTDEDIQPLVTPAYASMLRESVKLTLQEAQLAVLQHNQALYQLTLRQAVNKITQSFDVHDSNAEALLKNLNELQKIDLSLKKPETGQSLLLLNQVINGKQSPSSAEVQPGNTQHD